MSAGRMTLDEAGQLFRARHVHQSQSHAGAEVPESACRWCAVWPATFTAAVQAMDEKVLFRWTEALRSGAWTQAFGTLGFTLHARCALGVLGEVAAEDDVDFGSTEFATWLTGAAPHRQLSWLGHAVVTLNDAVKLSFAQIADLLDEAAAS